MVLVVIGLVFTVSNLVGFLRCRMGSSMAGAANQYVQVRSLESQMPDARNQMYSQSFIRFVSATIEEQYFQHYWIYLSFMIEITDEETSDLLSHLDEAVQFIQGLDSH